MITAGHCIIRGSTAVLQRPIRDFFVKNTGCRPVLLFPAAVLRFESPQQIGGRTILPSNSYCGIPPAVQRNVHQLGHRVSRDAHGRNKEYGEHAFRLPAESVETE